MSLRQRWLLFLVAASLWLAACSTAPTPRRLAQDAVTAMGGMEKLQSIQTLTMKGGAGTRFRLGQTQRATDPENAAQLKNVVEIADLATGRASLDYELNLGGFNRYNGGWTWWSRAVCRLRERRHYRAEGDVELITNSHANFGGEFWRT